MGQSANSKRGATLDEQKKRAAGRRARGDIRRERPIGALGCGGVAEISLHCYRRSASQSRSELLTIANRAWSRHEADQKIDIGKFIVKF